VRRIDRYLPAAPRLPVAAVHWLSIDGTDIQTDGRTDIVPLHGLLPLEAAIVNNVPYAGLIISLNCDRRLVWWTVRLKFDYFDLLYSTLQHFVL